jgi:hypothetical protein
MKHTSVLLSMLALPLLCSGADPAENRTASAAVDNGSEVLKAFITPWDCKGSIYAWETGESQPSHLLWTFAPDLGGWIHMTGQQLSTEHAPGPNWMTGMQYMGYDNLSQEYLIFGLDDHGGTWSQTGQFQGDGKIVYHGPYRSTVDGKLVASRDTWQVSGGNMYHTGEIERNGKYRKTDEEICTKKR